MVCCCVDCQRLGKRTLRELPYHYGRSVLVQQLCESVLFRAVQISPQTIAASSGVLESLSYVRKPTTAEVIKFRFDDEPAQYGMTDVYSDCKGSEFYATLWAFARDADIRCSSYESRPPMIEFSWNAKDSVSVWRNVLRIAYEWYAVLVPVSTLIDRHTRNLQKLATFVNDKKKQSSSPEEHKLMHAIVATRNATDSPMGWLNVDIDGAVCWYLYDVEWHVISKQTHRGVGDLVFANRLGMFAVVEVKYLNLKITGATARTKRNHQRTKLRAQTQKYGNAIRTRHPDALIVLPTFYTNEEQQVVLADDMDTDERRPRIAALVTAAKQKPMAVERTGPTSADFKSSPSRMVATATTTTNTTTTTYAFGTDAKSKWPPSAYAADSDRKSAAAPAVDSSAYSYRASRSPPRSRRELALRSKLTRSPSTSPPLRSRRMTSPPRHSSSSGPSWETLFTVAAVAAIGGTAAYAASRSADEKKEAAAGRPHAAAAVAAADKPASPCVLM